MTLEKFIPNTIEEKENYIIIKIESKGKVYDCLIDKEDYKKVKKYRWSLLQGKYAVSRTFKKYIRMHRMIMGFPKNLEIDHINGKTLDNRKSNLRIVTHHQNSYNTKAKGITWEKSRNKWVAQIFVNSRHLFLGRYDTEEEAKEARKQAEIKYFGEFRRIEG